MNDEKFVYNPIVKEYLNTLENYKTLLQNDSSKITNGIIENNNDDIAQFINGKMNDSYFEIISNMDKIISWWKSYDNDMKILKQGLINNTIINGEFENIKFKEVKEMINEELK